MKFTLNLVIDSHKPNGGGCHEVTGVQIGEFDTEYEARAAMERAQVGYDANKMIDSILSPE